MPARKLVRGEIMINRRTVCWGVASVLLPTSFSFAQDRKVRVATPGPAITTIPTQIVKVKKFDREEGLELEITPTPGAIAVKAMVGGDFDFTLSVGAALTAAVRGAPVRVVYVHVDKWL
jgi:ABC-type nitrate/sulfonate/bicarbonate transport system substrate-binding protein